MTITIELNPTKLPYITHEKDGVKRSHYAYHDQVVDLIQGSVDSDSEKAVAKRKMILTSPPLPPNTVRYGQTDNGAHFLFVTEAETACDIAYNSFSFENVAFPKMVFAYHVSGTSLVNAYVAVYKDISLRDTTQLFRFPYSNVHAGGKLCFWTNEAVKDLVQLQTFPYQWRDVPNNDHIYHVGQSNLTGDTLFEVYKAFQNCSFDYDILTPMACDFGAWSNQIMNL